MIVDIPMTAQPSMLGSVGLPLFSSALGTIWCCEMDGMDSN